MRTQQGWIAVTSMLCTFKASADSESIKFPIREIRNDKEPEKYHFLGINVFVNHISMQKQLFWYMVLINYTHILYMYILTLFIYKIVRLVGWAWLSW